MTLAPTHPSLGKTVLVIDDDVSTVKTLSMLLEIEGYRVKSARNGQKGWDLLRALDDLPCLILLDLTMPVMDGFEFRNQQLKDPRLADIPVAIMSANPNIRDTAKKVSVSHIIRKPIALESVLAILQQQCGFTQSE